MHEVCGVLTWKTHQAMNKDARVKLYLHEAKLYICLAWFLVHLSSQRTKERCGGIGVLCAASWLFIFFPAKGQWTTNFLGMLKELFFLDLLFTSMVKKNQIQKDSISMDPKMFAIFLFINYFFREFFFELKVFFYCSPIYIFIKTQARQ